MDHQGQDQNIGAGSSGISGENGLQKPIDNSSNSVQQPIQQTEVMTSAFSATQSTQAQQLHVSAGVIVLQWLMYAFWGWTALAILWLSSVSISYFFGEGYLVSETVAYSLAAVLVLLPISLVCDFFYSKKESIKKTGASSVVMIIHAVIFAICGVLSLIVAVFCLVNALIKGFDNMTQIAIICAAIMLFVYLILFIRTILPTVLFSHRRLFSIIMILISVALVGLSIAGPVAYSSISKNDKIIEDNLSTLSYNISSYVDSNGRLPDSLSSVNTDGGTKDLVDKNLVTYKNEDSSIKNTKETDVAYSSDYTEFRYQLCVEYKAESKFSSTFNRGSYNSDDYTDSPMTYNHPKGEVCYKLKVDKSN